jgi:hypothetical protein
MADFFDKIAIFAHTYFLLKKHIMIIQQLSIFLENKSGRLAEVLEILGKEDVNITALSVADTEKFGLVRIIAPEPDKARDILKQNGFTCNVTDVVSVVTPNGAIHYAKILKILSNLKISVEYTYAFSLGDKTTIILRCDDNQKAAEELKNHEIDLLTSGDLYKV